MHCINRVIAKPVTDITGRGDPYSSRTPLAPLCKGSCHGVTEGLSAAGRRKRTLKLLSLPRAVIRQSTPHRFAELHLLLSPTWTFPSARESPLTQGSQGDGGRIATTSVRTGLAMTHPAPCVVLRRAAPRPVRRTASDHAPTPDAGNCALCTVNCALYQPLHSTLFYILHYFTFCIPLSPSLCSRRTLASFVKRPFLVTIFVVCLYL